MLSTSSNSHSTYTERGAGAKRRIAAPRRSPRSAAPRSAADAGAQARARTGNWTQGRPRSAHLLLPRFREMRDGSRTSHSSQVPGAYAALPGRL